MDRDLGKSTGMAAHIESPRRLNPLHP